ncbi:hypothetical protein HYS97_03175 [Candidatus Daviesbacteria bacterium]|nr:hypothetical protein [Candidatus Daviesbacteria bacterium]
MSEFRKLTTVASFVAEEFDKERKIETDQKIIVDPVVAEVATWYEKIRNAMDYRDDDVILRAAIERIIKRRMLLGGNGATIAEPLVRELVWARYFNEDTVSESIIPTVEKIIDNYLRLQDKINAKHRLNKNEIYQWIMHLMSSEIEDKMSPSKQKDLLSNFMYQIYKDRAQIPDEDEETKNVQVFIGVRRAFAKDDLALLRYRLFNQLMGFIAEDKIEHISENWVKLVRKINSQINHPLKDRIYTYIKKQTIPLFILEDVLTKNKGHNKHLLQNQEELKIAVLNSCKIRYEDISGRVRRAIIRGIIFIVLTKAIFALLVEGTYERLLYGEVMWNSIAINTMFPPIIMFLAGVFIKTPTKENSVKIFERIQQLILEGEVGKIPPKLVKRTGTRDPIMYAVFIILWLFALFLLLGGIIYVLSLLGLTEISQFVFIFFMAIVSFISYRVNQTAHMYTFADEKEGIRSVLFDFFFMPFIHLGRQLTENISKINIFLYIFDLVIETPFKVLFSFFEQWFLYLRTQREKLG